VLVPFNLFCGSCFFCQRELYRNCHNTNPEATAVGGIYGYSHTTGGYDGGQAEFVRVPMADVGPYKILDDIQDEDAVLLTDALPTGYQAAEMGDIKEGDTVVVFGADRVNMVEGVVEDLAHGHVPNVLAEMGIRSELRHNPAGLVRKALVTAAVVGGIMAMRNRRRRY